MSTILCYTVGAQEARKTWLVSLVYCASCMVSVSVTGDGVCAILDVIGRALSCVCILCDRDE